MKLFSSSSKHGQQSIFSSLLPYASLSSVSVARLSTYVDRHIGPRLNHEESAMLSAVGYESMSGLLDDTIPSHIRLQNDELTELQHILGSGKEEHEALAELQEKMGGNVVNKSYIGMGYYDTITPSPVLRNMLENPSWYTPYTPYQAEISQGRLEMLLNFQTMVKDIVGKEVCNASLLDESTACAEAMTMALTMSGKKFKSGGESPVFVVSKQCHPQNIAVVQQRAEPLNICVRVVDDSEMPTALSENNVFGVLVQYPNTYGCVEQNLQELVSVAQKNDVHTVVSTDLLACTLLKPPGEYGVDIVVGSAQRFGVPLGFGGPHAAFLACDMQQVRKMPGRLIGVTKDTRNKPALRMALQTREQFIKRDKATSNICTAQVLLANVAAAYGIYHGPAGVRRIASRVHDYTKVLQHGLTQHLQCVELVNAQYFDTLTLRIKPSHFRSTAAILPLAYEHGLNLRPIDDEHLSISLDETTSLADINRLFEVFLKAMNSEQRLTAQDLLTEIDTFDTLPSSIRRHSAFMQHATFNTYHSETALMRYLYTLERKDLGLNTAMMPLGSCTMKLNSASAMRPVTWNTVNNVHPFAPHDQTKGYQSLIEDMETWLATITGFDAVSLQPNSGASGEYTGLLCIRQYHIANGQSQRNVCLIPTSAHGTNPASAAMCGYKIVGIKCDSNGYIDMQEFKLKAAQYQEQLAACMITYPSTHGTFEDHVSDLCQVVHEHGGLVYMDGANLQAQLTKTSPGKIGADVCHLNLHKTFCIPHGGGGPGLGPIGVNGKLKPFLPKHPVVRCVPADFEQSSIGPIAAAPWSSASILVIPWMYIRMMGYDGLERATSMSILAANYMAKRLENHYPIMYRRQGLCAHEFIIDCREFQKKDPQNPKQYVYKIGAEDIAKRLMDYTFHAPTMSWPVANTLMVEPTESEPLSELDRFCDAMIEIRKEIQSVEDNELSVSESPLRNAPHTMDMLVATEWNQKYSREQAAVDPYKSYWPTVGRVNNEYGDTHKICSCLSVEELMKMQEMENEQAKIL
eukprot:CAMPEP_0202687720 /NCGR_PEP_ID=MMETSP1385-20130828/3362_1 /ASSEMBLY_ACC=CAM_ASM_000861 /TAXON_ID=933848 /ORGANISM="Elphidium margaritaceum" /LENGTH=1027 /DNA_ID=CAMNT_0049342559 /DNA_START=74 /DNA_END=3157 /DNA_ORIENTATION=-